MLCNHFEEMTDEVISIFLASIECLVSAQHPEYKNRKLNYNVNNVLLIKTMQKQATFCMHHCSLQQSN